jgi:hypothetical protein
MIELQRFSGLDLEGISVHARTLRIATTEVLAVVRALVLLDAAWVYWGK